MTISGKQEISVYIFDLDDTLIDSSIYSRMYHELITELVKELKISEIELQKKISELKEKSGKLKADTFDLCRELNATEIYYRVLEKYVKHTYSLKAKEIPEIFIKIRKNKKSIGVVSNSQIKTIGLFLERFNLQDKVHFIESGDKKTVLFWITLEKKHAINKKTTLVIDDSDEILEVAKHCGYNVFSAKHLNKLEV